MSFLGVCRLAVVDPSTPATVHDSETGAVAAVVNGEIYNEPELRQILLDAGHTFLTGIDTEVVVHAYEEWGDAFVSRLNGMFALLLYDGKRQRMIAARDRLGVKPLFWTRVGGEVVLSSSARGLARLAGAGLDHRAILECLYRQSIRAPRTAFSGVNAIPEGTLATFEGGAVHMRRFWRPAPCAPEEVALSDVLLAACSRQARADRPTALAMSGGIDSGLLASAVRETGLAQRLVCLAPPDGVGETPEAAASAGAHGQTLVVLPFPVDWREAFNAWSRHADQPPADGFNVYALCRSIAGRDVVLHSGIGADELFNGYPELAALVGERPDVESAVHRFFNVTALFPTTVLQRVGATIGVSPEEVAADLVADAIAEVRGAEVNDPMEALRILLLRYYLTPCLLSNADDCSMAHGIEVRVPWLDNAMVDAALALNYRAMARDGLAKRPLRELGAQREVPACVLGAPKRGFALPYEAMDAGLSTDGSVLRTLVDVPATPAAPYRRWVLRALGQWVDTVN